MQVRVEAPMLGERGVFFSILWGLRQGEREAEHWEVQQLNSVHCNRTRAGRSRSPAFLQSAVYAHDCRCAMGRWEGVALLHYQIRLIACIYRYVHYRPRETKALSLLFQNAEN